ncbi:metal ABC transporter ATP-binding protein [Sporolituus thermophilus]|uniref:Zinc transport system ATP-binding protein n=1 Tax=Sporolituus thermophilus DSM 23256 TaxID=1123285 RepID=A0A1G7IAG6_9FIRM|nr:metal ABC transporter ATP-binding protein [Sporolituus thermophilus]SDF09506.1 zinc transport system ATP-binding protein [Sporolituus thermophilus DSM 23256]
MCMVQLDGVCFAYDDYPVLNNISLAVASGDFLVVVGPNGAGKSTLLKIMAGIAMPQGGEVRIDGRPVREAQRQGLIGYVPQTYGKNSAGFPATVEEVVALGLVTGSVTRRSKQLATHIVEHMLELVDMTGLRSRRIGELSGGQLQRVMVARALAGNPRLLLLDEPTSGIDADASAKIYELLGTLNRNLGITVVMVSHDIEKATCWASRVACINRGLCFFGSGREFRDSHMTVRHFWYETGRGKDGISPI